MASPVFESRLFETVRLIRDWIDKSFDPAGEERFRKAGKLKARFDVDLGSEMQEQLQAYMKASFMLSRVHLRFTTRDDPGKAPRPCVEVLLDIEARALYASKNPKLTAKSRGTPLALTDEGAEGHKFPALTDGKSAEVPAGAIVVAPPGSGVSPPAPGCKQPSPDHQRCEAHEGEGAAKKSYLLDNSGLQSKAPGLQWRRSTSLEDMDSGPPAEWGTVVQGIPRGHWLEVSGRFLPARIRGTRVLREVVPDAGETPAKRRRAAAEGSVWSAVPAHCVAPGVGGVTEAREALEAALRKREQEGMAALKAEKDAVAWLKGLSNREVSLSELKETLVGQAVNAWRKHPEPFISDVATSLLGKWKATFREASAGAKSKLAELKPSVSDARR